MHSSGSGSPDSQNFREPQKGIAAFFREICVIQFPELKVDNKKAAIILIAASACIGFDLDGQTEARMKKNGDNSLR